MPKPLTRDRLGFQHGLMRGGIGIKCIIANTIAGVHNIISNCVCNGPQNANLTVHLRVLKADSARKAPRSQGRV